MLTRNFASWINMLGRRLATAINAPGGNARPFLNTGALLASNGDFLTTSGGDHIAYVQANP